MSIYARSMRWSFFARSFGVSSASDLAESELKDCIFTTRHHLVSDYWHPNSLHQDPGLLMQRTYGIKHVVTTIRRASTRAAPLAVKPARAPLGSGPPRAKRGQQTNAKEAPTPLIPSPPQAAPQPEKATLTRLTPSRAVPFLLASLVASALGFYTLQLYLEVRQPCHNPQIASLAAQKDVSARYDETADSFDAEVGVSEWLSGINKMRKKLALQCRGHVLEVSCGTGRNLGYFDLGPGSAVESLTFVDLSPQMVEVCRRKWDVLIGEDREGLEQEKLSGKPLVGKMKRGLVVRFLVGSALEEMPPPPPVSTTAKDDKGASKTMVATKSKYTTILQTMGVCSTPEPHKLLASLASHLDTSNPEARILLLEHGRSYQPWLNRVLDNSAEKHAEIHGCWSNRDIGAIVDAEARKAGLEVKRLRRPFWHLGTTWVYELGVGEELLARMKQEGTVEAGQPAMPVETGVEVGKAGWSAWLPWK